MNTLIAAVGLLLIILGVALSVLLAVRTGSANRVTSVDGAPVPQRKAPKWPLAFVVLGLAGIVGGNCFTVVPTGYTGVRTTFGLIDQESCIPGFNFVTPFVQNISLVNNKQQDLRFSDQIWSETQEQTVVYMENVTVTYQIVPEASAWIYANVENWVEELVDVDIVSSALKTASRGLSADVVTDRSIIEPAARDCLQAALDSKYGGNRVIVKNVIINNMDFDESYNKAKAEANRIISESISEAIQRQDAIDKWNGELPRYAGGGDMSFGIIDAVTAAPAPAPASTPSPASVPEG